MERWKQEVINGEWTYLNTRGTIDRQPDMPANRNLRYLRRRRRRIPPTSPKEWPMTLITYRWNYSIEFHFCCDGEFQISPTPVLHYRYGEKAQKHSKFVSFLFRNSKMMYFVNLVLIGNVFWMIRSRILKKFVFDLNTATGSNVSIEDEETRFYKSLLIKKANGPLWNASRFYKIDEVHASLREIYTFMAEWMSPTSMGFRDVPLTITEHFISSLWEETWWRLN